MELKFGAIVKKQRKIFGLASSIMSHLENTKIGSNRGIKHGTIEGENKDYYVLKNTNMPSCLIELGFISNEQDNQLLDKNKKEYAKAIADGIVETVKE